MKLPYNLLGYFGCKDVIPTVMILTMWKRSSASRKIFIFLMPAKLEPTSFVVFKSPKSDFFSAQKLTNYFLTPKFSEIAKS
jgi:hypothetical protein